MNEHGNPFGNGDAAQSGADSAVVGGGAGIKDTTTATFAADVIQESRRQPVLVDFWAPWCGPCKQLAPSLEKVVGEAAGRVKLVKMNIDDHPAIPGQLGIQSIPAVIAFRDGQPVDGFMGAIPESRIREFVERIAGPDSAEQARAEALAAAADIRAEGDFQGAAQIYAAILKQDPASLEALGGLSETLVDAGDIATARDVLARAPEGSEEAPELVAARTRLALAEQVAELGDPAELERRLAANAADHDARFDLALIQNALGEREQAADNLLAIMKADRSWRDDGARLQLLKLFEVWGMADEATLSARRKLSSLLFS